MARLFVESARLGEDVLVLADEDHRYLTRVLRLAVGDQVVLFDGVGVEAEARIVRVGPRALELKIAREASRQCGRAQVPEIEPVTAFSTALAATAKDAFKLLMWEGEREHTLRAVLPAEPPPRIVVAVGPEGGFALEEVEAARAA